MINSKSLLPLLILVLVFSCKITNNVDSFPVKTESTALYNHTWQLEYMSNAPIALDSLFGDKIPNIAFDDIKKLVRGNAGCNGYSATYEKEGDNISFSDPGPSTLMYCGEGEQQFLNMMKKVNRYSLDENGKLNLMIDDIPLMRFKKE